MEANGRPTHLALRLFLVVDATLLLVLGAGLLLFPDKAQLAFHFEGLPAAVSYILGLLGCVFLSLGIGYAVAATDPVKHVAWISVGIARASIEVVFGLVCVARGVIVWQQASFGIIIAAIVALVYVILYPRRSAA